MPEANASDTKWQIGGMQKRIKKSKTAIFLLGSIIFFLLWQFNENRQVEIHIPSTQGKDLILNMPRKDQKSLACLFRKMVALDCGGYTLFGSKPMHMCCYIIPFSTKRWDVFLNSLSPRNLRIYWGWKTWLKYQHLFEKSEFLLWAEENPFWIRWFQAPNPAISILLIHKQKLQDTINTHIIDFQTVLDRNPICCEQLLLEAKGKPFLKEVLKDHDGLIGTLFGYGRDNAWLFEERNQGKEVPLVPIWDEEIYDFLGNRPISMWLWLGICSEDLSEVLGYPTFLANPNSLETQELKKKFLNTRGRIIDYYKDKDFLETTLSILLDGSPKAKR
jgi:hypothetical protein